GRFLLHGDRQPPAGGHGIARVDGEVEQHLLNLPGIDFHEQRLRGAPGGPRVPPPPSPPLSRCTSRSVCATSSLASISRVSIVWRRANARSCFVRSAARVDACRIPVPSSSPGCPSGIVIRSPSA